MSTTRVFVRLYDGTTQCETSDEVLYLPPPPLKWKDAIAAMVTAVGTKSSAHVDADATSKARLFLLPTEAAGIAAEVRQMRLLLDIDCSGWTALWTGSIRSWLDGTLTRFCVCFVSTAERSLVALWRPGERPVCHLPAGRGLPRTQGAPRDGKDGNSSYYSCCCCCWCCVSFGSRSIVGTAHDAVHTKFSQWQCPAHYLTVC